MLLNQRARAANKKGTGVIGKLRRASAELGFWNALCYGFDQLLYDRLGWGGLARYRFYAQPVPPPPERPLRMGAQEVRELERGDPAFADLPLGAEVLDYRFAQGAVCHAVIEDGRAVACLWFCFSEYREDMVRAVYRMDRHDPVTWDFDVYVAPSHRSGRTFARLWQAGNAYLRRRGIQWSLSRISAYNLASITSHERLGARVVGRAAFLWLGPLQIVVSSLTPRLHVSWRQGGPEMLVRPPEAGRKF